MPNFVDYHRVLPLMTPQDVQDMVEKIRNGDSSQYGVGSWHIYVGLDGQAWFYSEADRDASVLQAQESMKIHQGPEKVSETEILG